MEDTYKSMTVICRVLMILCIRAEASIRDDKRKVGLTRTARYGYGDATTAASKLYIEGQHITEERVIYFISMTASPYVYS